MVLIDTSVWIEFFRNPRSELRSPMSHLMETGRVAIVDPIVTELLYGARGRRERDVILDLANGAERLELSGATWIAAGDLGKAWRSRGRTLSVVDCLLAAACREHSTPLWTLDRDFAVLAEEGEIELFRAIEAGP